MQFGLSWKAYSNLEYHLRTKYPQLDKKKKNIENQKEKEYQSAAKNIAHIQQEKLDKNKVSSFTILKL